jgi:4-aminobutyrate aminotransferase
VKKCIEKAKFILLTSAFEVIKLIPPLNISKQDSEKGCAIFLDAVKDVVKEGYLGLCEDRGNPICVS